MFHVKHCIMALKEQKLGQIGENLAEEYLKSLDYEILDRNYREKWGEIDIVAKKGEIIVFIEVKTLNVSRETLFNPFENITYKKKRNLKKSARMYLVKKRYSPETEWQIDVIAIETDPDTGKSSIQHIPQAVY